MINQPKQNTRLSVACASVGQLAKAVTTTVALLGSVQAATDEVVYFHTDALGSPVAAFSESGAVCWTETYSPYGEKLDREDSLAPDEGCGLLGTDVGYTGHVQDGSGLVYAQQRYYDPQIGRFMSTDPVKPSARDPRYFGRYQYAGNNPYKYVDPDGGNIAVVAVGAGVLAVATVAAAINAVQGTPDNAGEALSDTWGGIVDAIGGLFSENSKEHTEDEKSLQDMIKQDTVGGRSLTPEEVEAYGELAGELGLDVEDDRSPEKAEHWGDRPHIHIGRGPGQAKMRSKKGDDHIPAEPDVGIEESSDGNGGEDGDLNTELVE